MAPLRLDGDGLQLFELAAVLSDDPPQLVVTDEAWQRVESSRAVVERVVDEGETVYGINTGFGRLARVAIDADKLEQLQRNLILSHATGVGAPLSPAVSRLMLVLRIQSLVKGCSGVTRALVERLLALYERGLIPVIPEQGSVGASGDLAPLAHMALVLFGMGEVWLDDARFPADDALRSAGIDTFRMSAKEGLALINGTQCMTAIGIATWLHGVTLVKTADIGASLSLEALRGSVVPFREDVQLARPHPGQIATAANMRRLLADSEIGPSHAHCEKVQDPYSLRCVPQVHGSVRDALTYAGRVLELEVNAATDNPLLMPDGSAVSAGNFHGQPVAQALDFLGIALATLANISERRIENMVNPDLSGLPAFLAHDPGMDSGFMIPQVVAASLVSENKSLAHPASVDSIPTSANREDHVSMGVTAARHARDICANTAKVLGIELICGAQGLSFDRSLRAGVGAEAAFAAVRAHIPELESDRWLAPDLAAAEELVSSGTIIEAVEAVVGELE